MPLLPTLPILATMFHVQVDALGRILIPKQVRDRLGLKPGTRLLGGELAGRVVLEPDERFGKEWRERVARELEGVDVMGIMREVREESNELARQLYGPATGLNLGGRGLGAPAPAHAKPRVGRKARGKRGTPRREPPGGRIPQA